MSSKIPNFEKAEDAMNYLECLKFKNEDLKQSLYDKNKAKSIEDTFIHEIKAEVELLRNKLEAISEPEPIKLETEDIKILREQIRKLEIDRKEEQEENEKLYLTYADVQAKKNPKDENEILPISTLNKAKEENKNLKKLIESQKIKNEVQIETLEVIEKLKKQTLELKEEYDQFKLLHDAENSKLESIEKTLQAVRAENSKFSSEITALKANPVDDIQRGNCLFAEVEDRSSDLVMRHKLINMKYHHLTKIFRQTKMQHLSLRNTNARLYSRVGTNDTNQVNHDCDLAPSSDLNRKILELEALMSTLDQRSLVPKLVLENDDLKWFQTILNKESSAVKTSTEKVRHVSKQLYNTVVEMCKVSVEAEKMRQKNMKNEGEIKELMAKYSERENKENTCNNTSNENKNV